MDDRQRAREWLEALLRRVEHKAALRSDVDSLAAILDSVRREAVHEALGSAILAIGTLKIMAHEAGDTTAWRYLDDAMARIRALATPTKSGDE